MSFDNYSLQKPDGFIDRLASKKRRQMFDLFLKEFPESTFDTVLDVGVTADQDALSSNFFEQYLQDKNKITACSDQDARFLEQRYPGLRFKEGDAKALPFADNSMDIVFSSAVLEHVGSFDNQKKMISECWRVAKKGIFITTPNRWYPIEMHTLLPLIHWFPKRLHRSFLKWVGLAFYSREENLNLLDQADLLSICHALQIQSVVIRKISTWGWVSNLILIVKKEPKKRR